MHDLLDDYAQTNALREVSPKLKLMLGLGSILLCVFSFSCGTIDCCIDHKRDYSLPC